MISAAHLVPKRDKRIRQKLEELVKKMISDMNNC